MIDEADEVDEVWKRASAGSIRERERQRSTRRKFLKRSGGVTIAVTLSALAAPSLLEAETSI